jgi:hypothetical protein
MNTHLISTRCANAAIAAVLALGSTGLLAQAAIPEATPVIAPPPPAQAAPVVVAPPPAQQTIIVPSADLVPTTPPQATVPAPVIITPAEPEAAAATPAATRTTTRTTRAAPAAVAAPEPTTETTATEETTEPFAPEVEPVFVPPVELSPAEAERQAEASTRPDLLDFAGYAIAALAFLALLAFIFRRSRKPKRYAAKPEQARPIERREPLPATAPVAAAPELPATPPIVSTAFGDRPTVAPMATYRREPALRPDGAVVLPRRVPEDFRERDALIKRMVAAKPDRANPFRSHKARHHRAKLILQSIGQSFRDRDPWIDLSGYPDIWPEVAHRKFPHAA